MRKLGEEPIVQCLPLWFPWVASRNGPVGQRPLTPLLLPAPPVRANSFTHHAILSRRIVPNDEHHGAAANRKHCPAWSWGQDTKRGGWRARGHSPECLGVGHRSGPVNVQVSAATGRGRGGIPGLGGGGGPKPDTSVISATLQPISPQLGSNIPGGPAPAPE